MRLTVPKTWAGLMSLTAKIKREGETPWALAAEDAWTLTDWFENVYIRTAGPWKYDGLFAGRLPFDDPSVISALRRMSAILDDRYLAGGKLGALGTDYGEVIYDFFGPRPGAHLFMEGGFVGTDALTYVKPRPTPGRTIGAAPFPSIDTRVGNPVVVGADVIVALEADEAIGKLLLYLSSRGAARIWVSTGAMVSPHKALAPDAYPNTLVRAEALQLTNAEVVRFDGSDLLPRKLGRQLGATLQRIVRHPERAEELMSEFQREAARVLETD
jgi:alpha-glucoside transport system substrate-binding protein